MKKVTTGKVQGLAVGQNEFLAGYLILPIEKVDQSFNAGFSTYIAAWACLPCRLPAGSKK